MSNTQKSRVAQPKINFTKDALLSMLRSHFLFSLFIHLDWLFYAEFESVISFSLRFVAKKYEWYSETHISHIFQILNSRLELGAVKPLIDVFWNKWYQQTQKIILYYLEQEKLKDIHISEKKFQYTKKSSRPTQYHFH